MVKILNTLELEIFQPTILFQKLTTYLVTKTYLFKKIIVIYKICLSSR